MASTKHDRKLLTIVAEATLEKKLAKLALKLGAHGYTVVEAHGEGWGGHAGEWEADRTIQMQVLAEETVAEAIAERVIAEFGRNYNVALWLSDARIFRPERF